MKKLVILMTLCFALFFTSCLTSKQEMEEKEDTTLKVNEAYNNLNANKNYRTEIELELISDGNTETGSITKNMTEEITKYSFVSMGLNLEFYEYIEGEEKHTLLNANFLDLPGSNKEDKWIDTKSKINNSENDALGKYFNDEYYDLVDGVYVLNETGKEKIKSVVEDSSTSSILEQLPNSSDIINFDNYEIDIKVKVDSKYITSVSMNLKDKDNNEITVKIYFNKIDEVSLTLPKNIMTMEEYLKELIGNLPSIPDLDEDELKDKLEDILTGGK